MTYLKTQQLVLLQISLLQTTTKNSDVVRKHKYSIIERTISWEKIEEASEREKKKYQDLMNDCIENR